MGSLSRIRNLFFFFMFSLPPLFSTFKKILQNFKRRARWDVWETQRTTTQFEKEENPRYTLSRTFTVLALVCPYRLAGLNLPAVLVVGFERDYFKPG